MSPTSNTNRPNLLDRVVGYISPRSAVDRLRARSEFSASIGGYEGGRSSRRALKEFKPQGGSANADLLPNVAVLRSRTRDLARNSPIAVGAVNTTVTNVVGTGLRPQSRVDREVLGMTAAEAEVFQNAAEREFRLWAGSQECDLTRTQTFAGLQDLVFRSVLESGDVFAINRMVERAGSPFGFKLQIIEADRCSNPNHKGDTAGLTAGIEFDTNGAPTVYHFRTTHPGDRRTIRAEWKGVRAFSANAGRRNVLHLFDRKRPGLARGVPYLAPVIEPLKQLQRYSDAEIMAAVINSCFAIGIKSEGGHGLDTDTDTSTDEGNAINIMEPGIIYNLGSNEEIESFTPGRPNQGFDPFFVSIVRQIGVALDLPFEVLIRHFTASYSASRAALEMAWQFFRVRRDWLATNFCQPCYENVLVEAIARGRLHAPGFQDPLIRAAYFGTEWIGPSRISLDPLREAKADQIHTDMGVKTLSEVTAEKTGGDWEQKHPQSALERKRRIEDGLAAPSGAPPADPNEEDDEPANSAGSSVLDGDFQDEETET